MSHNPMGRRNYTRAGRVHEIRRLLKEGPASLSSRSAFTPGGDAGEAARVYLWEQFQLWRDTWLTPQLDALFPPAAAPDARVAPWPDFAGGVIREGDTLRHPDGTSFVVRYYPEAGELNTDPWRADYGPDSPQGRLLLQIGPKGRACVVREE